MIRKLAQFIERRFLWITVLTLVALLPFFGPLSQLKVEHSFDAWIDHEGDLYRTYQEFTRTFGGDDTVLLVFGVHDLLASRPDSVDEDYPRSPLEDYLEVIPRLARMDGVVGVIDPIGEWFGSSGPGALVGLEFFDPDRREEYRKRMEQLFPGSIGFLLSRDLETAGLLLFLDPARREDHPRILDAIELEWQRVGIPVDWAGVSWFSKTLSAAITRDMMVVVTLLVFAALAVVHYYFASLSLIVITLIAMGLAIGFTLGTAQWFGIRMTLFGLILFPLVFCVVLTSVIHLLSLRGRDGVYRFADAFSYVFKPATSAAVTTAVGAMAFLFSPQEALRHIGWILPLGIMVSFIISMMFIPSAMRLVSGTWERVGAGRGSGGVWFGMVGDRSMARSVIGGTLLVLALGAALLLPRLVIDANALNFFEPTSDLMRSYRAIEDRLGGLLRVELLIDCGGKGTVTEPVRIAAIEAFLAEVRRWPQLSGSAGGGDVLRERDPAIRHRWIKPDESLMRVTLGFSQREDYKRIEADLHRLWQHKIPTGTSLSLRLTGQLPLILAAQDRLLESQFDTFALVFLLISLFLGLGHRSWRIFVLALVANFVPLVITGGLMVVLGVAINSMNFFVASVMLGVIVDDTMHLLHALDVEHGFDAGLVRVGKALWITTATVFIAFLTLTVSRIVPIAQFGWLSALTVLVAWLCDLYLLPFLLARFARRIHGRRSG
ncbi:MAG: hypothetical protein HQL76_01260 [Magnetococcales bacterium]|nr:hypothetical protein [Magnetococcales bacterium]